MLKYVHILYFESKDLLKVKFFYDILKFLGYAIIPPFNVAA